MTKILLTKVSVFISLNLSFTTIEFAKPKIAKPILRCHATRTAKGDLQKKKYWTSSDFVQYPEQLRRQNELTVR
jgi:hypothetical protein